MIDKTRFKRQLLLKEVGEEGQAKLASSRVLIIGAGGLGSPVILYLTAAGVGTLGIIDCDRVDLSNLQRQIVHNIYNIGQSKVVSATEKARAINPEIKVITYDCRFDRTNAADILSNYDVVVEATDNSESKFFINDACVEASKPLVTGAIREFAGTVMTVMPGCATYRDVFNNSPQSSQDSASYGVLGAVTGVVGSIQAIEVLKIILGAGDLLTNKILTIDTLSMEFNTFHVSKS